MIDGWLDDGGRPTRYEVEFPAWSERGHWYPSGAMYRAAPDGRLATWLPGHGPERPGPARHDRRFLGRTLELGQLAAALSDGGDAAVCNVNGMAGVGKTWLVEEFHAANRDRFPGGLIYEAIERGSTATTEDLLARLADRATAIYGTVVSARDPALVLATTRPLVFLDNIDTEELALAAPRVLVCLAPNHSSVVGVAPRRGARSLPPSTPT